MRLYVDTSALVKLLIREPESERAHELWVAAARRFSSTLAHVESRSALARARHAGRLTSRQHARTKHELENLLAEIDLVEVTPDLARAAGEIGRASCRERV